MTLIAAIAHVTIGAALILQGDRRHGTDPGYAVAARWWLRAGFMLAWSGLLVLALVLRLIVGGNGRPPGPPAGGTA